MRPALHRLAEAYGILPSWVDADGRRHVVSDATREALLEAWGVPASTEAAARGSLEARARRRRARLVAPVRVVRAGRGPHALDLRVDAPDGAALEVFCVLLLETGEVVRAVAPARARGRRARVVLKTDLPPGAHEVRVTCGDRTGRQTLCVVPDRCHEAAVPGSDAGLVGLCANLYAARSRRDWGVGDLGDLAALGSWAGRRGFSFVGVNPLHALRNAGHDVSPYSPLSRVFLNELYLDPLAVPEWDAGLLDGAGPRVEALARERHVRYDDVAALKRLVLRRLHGRFVERELGHDTARARDYRRFVAEGGQALHRYAVFRVLEARHGAPWQAWPAGVRSPDGEDVERFAREHADEIGFETWLQFETDRQLGAAAGALAGDGVAAGLCLDLAVGSAPDGADAWSWPRLFLDGVRLGCPPDAFDEEGQEWGLPAIDPLALADDGYGYWRAVLEASMRHAGMLRVDHVAGLFRQWWIPRGTSAAHGAYVRQPGADLMGLIALASRRAGTIVVGEDLGTVPDAVPRALRAWGLLGSRVLYFARTRAGRFRAARTQPRGVLLTATTHDLAPLAGYLCGRDLEQRRSARERRRARTGDGAGADEPTLEAQQRARGRDRLALVRRLLAEGAFEPPDPSATNAGAAVRGAVHRMLARSPARAVAVWLEDLVGEPDAVNLPGFGPDDHPSWSRRLSRDLETLDADDAVTRSLGEVTRVRPGAGHRPATQPSPRGSR